MARRRESKKHAGSSYLDFSLSKKQVMRLCAPPPPPSPSHSPHGRCKSREGLLQEMTRSRAWYLFLYSYTTRQTLMTTREILRIMVWWGLGCLRAEKETMSSLPFACQSSRAPGYELFQREYGNKSF